MGCSVSKKEVNFNEIQNEPYIFNILMNTDKIVVNSKNILYGLFYLKTKYNLNNLNMELSLSGYKKTLFYNNLGEKIERKYLLCFLKKNSNEWIDFESNKSISFNFDFKLNKNFKNSYTYYYKDNNKVCYWKFKTVLELKIKDTTNQILFSKNMEIFVSKEKENNYEKIYRKNLKNHVFKFKSCNNILNYKGTLELLNNKNFILSNEDEKIKIILKGNGADSIKINLLGVLEIFDPENNKTKAFSKIMFKLKKELKNENTNQLEFIIKKNLVNLYFCNLDEDIYKHNFFFKIEFFKGKTKFDTFMKFPMIIKNGKYLKTNIDHNLIFKYYKGNKKDFEGKFPKSIDYFKYI